MILESTTSLKRLNRDELLALPDDEFMLLYRIRMQAYKDCDGYWSSPEKIPKCNRCHEVIDGPKDLRKMVGMCLHPDCFAEQLEEDKKEQRGDPQNFPYFERVAKLKFDF